MWVGPRLVAEWLPGWKCVSSESVGDSQPVLFFPHGKGSMPVRVMLKWVSGD